MQTTIPHPNGSMPHQHQSQPSASRASMERINANLANVIRGKAASIELILIALASGGHVLLEDAPGTGKTTLAKAIAGSMSGEFRRIQFTPDLLPADITGSSFYNAADGSFEFRPGPVFANVLLADEINRSSPRTQSALLEVMSEHQVTTDGHRHVLPEPFFVVATQNPLDYQGTYPLPEAQLDRFLLHVTLGYPDAANELDIIYAQNDHHPLADLRPVVTTEQIIGIQEDVKTVKVDRSIGEYIVQIVQSTRQDGRLRLPLSPRGSLGLYRTSQARAWLHNRDYVVPEDVRALAEPVLGHRLVLDTKARYSGSTPDAVIKELLDSIPVPR